jgi:hypothetical protein
MAGYDDFDDKRIKHLEMIQGVVARLAGNSFLIKGWALTLTGAFLGFAVDREDSALAIAAFGPILFFWGLDAYYLWAERMFRELYRQVRNQDPSVEPFFMGATSGEFVKRAENVSSVSKTAQRRALWGFYVPLCVAAGAVLLIICT